MGTREVAIFWDYENCPAPAGRSGCHLVKQIRCLVQPFGPVKLFKAYLSIAEQSQLTRNTVLRSELQASGVSLTDTPHNSRKDVADKMMIVDMLTHAMDNPAPATIILISGDRDFAYAISVLRLRQYDIVLITLSNAHTSLTSQASTCFDWAIDVLGTAETNTASRTSEAKKDLDEFKFPSLKFVPAPVSPMKVPSTLPKASPRKQQSKASSSEEDSMDQGSPKPPYNPSLPRFSPSPGNMDLPTSPTVDPFYNFYRKRSSSEDVDPFQSTSGRSFRELPSFPGSPKKQSIYRESSPPLPVQGQTPATPDKPAPIPISINTAKDTRVFWTSTTTLTSNSASSSYISAEEDFTTPRPKGVPYVPSHFRPLVRLLQSYHERQRPRPFAPSVGAELQMAEKDLFISVPNVKDFAEYAELASKAGIVETGGFGRDEWISLTPEYLNVVLS